MKLFKTFFAVAAAGAISLSAADLSKFIDAKRWEKAECTIVTEGNALVVNMPVDHKAGQKDYPIGWPRIYLRKFFPQETDWSKAKAISFDLKPEFTGKSEKYPINFHFFWNVPNAKKMASCALVITPELKNNTVNKVVIPLTKAGDTSKMGGIGFNINESQYKHGDNFKFTVSNFKLVEK